MSDLRKIETYLRQAEEVITQIGETPAEKSTNAIHDVNLPGAEPMSTSDLPDGVEDLKSEYPGVRKVGIGRRVFHMVPPALTGETWDLTDTKDEILVSADDEGGLIEALGDVVSLTKPGQESKSAIEGRSRPLTVDEALEHIMMNQADEIDEKVLGSAHPGARRLRRYWLRGEGALKIRWGTSGDWTRCYRQLRKYMGVRAKGYCNLMHKRANGYYPGDRRNKDDETDLEQKRHFDQDEREDAADEGHALPDGSFPIESVEDLKNAVQAYGRAKDKERAKKHIRKRARALDREDLLPDTWDEQKDLSEAAMMRLEHLYLSRKSFDDWTVMEAKDGQSFDVGFNTLTNQWEAHDSENFTSIELAADTKDDIRLALDQVPHELND